MVKKIIGGRQAAPRWLIYGATEKGIIIAVADTNIAMAEKNIAVVEKNIALVEPVETTQESQI